MYQTLPNATGGSIRSHEIVRAELNRGLDCCVLSSPFQSPRCRDASREEIDGVLYLRSATTKVPVGISEQGTGLIGKAYKVAKLIPLVYRLDQLVRSQEPDVLHAHNNFLMASAALWVGRRRGIPVVYEVRSLWEERLANVAHPWIGRLLRRIVKRCENVAMKMADSVVVISEGLADDVENRCGVRSEIVRNAVRVSAEEAMGADKVDRLTRIGYAGSISPIEGLGQLAEAFCHVHAHNPSISLHYFGDGMALGELRERFDEHEAITFHGRFDYFKRANVYSQVDLIVLPRLPLRIAEAVTPLKPLEAMAYGCPVLASDVGGHREIIENGENGWLFRAGDVDDLTKHLRLLTDHDANIDKIVEVALEAQEQVRTQGSWSTRVAKYISLYHKVSEESQVDSESSR